MTFHSAPAMTDLIGGQIPFSVDTVAAALPQSKLGKVRVLALSAPARSSFLPDVPTFAEQGYKSVVLGPFAVVAVPAETPKPVIDKLAAAVAQAHKNPEVVKFLNDRGAVPLLYGPDETKVFLNRRRVMTKQLLDAVGIKPE